MNARTIKRTMRAAGFDITEWQIEKGYKCYNIFLKNFGLSDNERQQMTGDQVNAKRQADNDKVKKVAQLFNVFPERSGIKINDKYAPAIW